MCLVALEASLTCSHVSLGDTHGSEGGQLKNAGRRHCVFDTNRATNALRKTEQFKD